MTAGPRARERSDTISSLHEGLIAEELSDNDSRYLRKLFANDSADSSNGTCCGTATATTSDSAEDMVADEGEDDEDGEDGRNPIPLSEYQEIRSGILESQAGNGMIGDWQVKQCEPEGIRLVVNPGYGASRKTSFTQLDVSAVLSYTFALRPTSAPQLFINGLKVSSGHIRSIYEGALSKGGLLNLLYNLLTLRPCFGCFSPELVETVAKGENGDGKGNGDVYVDRRFVGSSANGRNYAGTVR